MFDFLPKCGIKVCLRKTGTGIFPFNRTKFGESRLSKSKVKAYNRWIFAGKPENEEGIPTVLGNEQDIPNVPVAPSRGEDTDMTIMPSTSKPSTSMPSTSKPRDSSPLSRTSTPLSTVPNFSPCSSRMSDYTVPTEEPPKECQHSQSCCLHLHNLQELAEAIGKVVSTKKSLEQFISNRQRPNQAKKTGCRRVLGKGATVLTQDEVVSSLEEREKAQKEK